MGIRREWPVGLGLVAGLSGLVIGIAADHAHGRSDQAPSAADLGPLTPAQFSVAARAARAQIAAGLEGVTGVRATLRGSPGRGNLAPCPHRTIRVEIDGLFPHIATGDGRGPVTSVAFYMGLHGGICDRGVSKGPQRPIPGAADLTATVLSAP